MVRAPTRLYGGNGADTLDGLVAESDGIDGGGGFDDVLNFTVGRTAGVTVTLD